MNPQVTQQQREQVANHWRTHGQGQGLAPNQIEDLAQRILTGGADDQVRRLMAQTQSQFQGQQQQQQPAGSGIQTPFGTLTLPPMPSMPMSNFPAMNMPTIPPQPMFPPMPGVPQLSVPMFAQQTTALPGGNGYQQNTAFSGTQGGAKFSYSSSSTSFSTVGNTTSSTFGMPQNVTLPTRNSAPIFPATQPAIAQPPVQHSFGTSMPLGRLQEVPPPEHPDIAVNVRRVPAENVDSDSDDSDLLDERILQTHFNNDPPDVFQRRVALSGRSPTPSPRRGRSLSSSSSESDSDRSRSRGRRGLGGIGDDLERALESISLARGAVGGATQHLRERRDGRRR